MVWIILQLGRRLGLRIFFVVLQIQFSKKPKGENMLRPVINQVQGFRTQDGAGVSLEQEAEYENK